jgi:hypothetical protein
MLNIEIQKFENKKSSQGRLAKGAFIPWRRRERYD